jgi:hypothetical protein
MEQKIWSWRGNKTLQKKTSSQRRMFFRLLNHSAIEYRKGKELPPKVKELIENIQTIATFL